MALGPIEELVTLLTRLPGVGRRTATRYAFHLLSEPPEVAAALGRALGTLHERVRRCERCGNWGEQAQCEVCRDPGRDGSQLCVVARVQDLLAIESAGAFRGRYHVLHGLLAPLEGVGPEQLPLEPLLRRVRDEGVREVVLATPLSVEGEATAHYVAEALAPLEVTVSRIASGVPLGGELELTDRLTLGRAFAGRRRFHEGGPER